MYQLCDFQFYELLKIDNQYFLNKNYPGIGRWTGIDPVVHYRHSTYNAFDGNPVFWADPSGADSSSGGFSTDVFGRERFDDNGIYIPFGERVGSNFENYFKDESLNDDGGGAKILS